MLEELGPRRRRGEPRRRLGGRHAQQPPARWPPSPRRSSRRRGRPTRTSWKPSRGQVLEEAQELSALDLVAVFDAQNRVTRSVGAFFTEYDLLVTPTLGAAAGAARHAATRRPGPHARGAGTSRSSTTARSPPSSTSPGNRRSACRWRTARAGCRSACSSSRPTAARICCSTSPPSSNRPCPGSGRTPNSYVGQRDHALGSAHAQRRSPSASRSGRARAHGVGERA